jgi:hypothetical protein
MKIDKNDKTEIDFCEECGKDVKKQKVPKVICDCGFYHFPCKECLKKKKYSEI